MKRYRLYVDESGDHTYTYQYNPDSRYLGLTGIAIESDYYRTVFQPELEKLKQEHFPHSPDEPVILVRSLIVGRKRPFGRLTDPVLNAAWETGLLSYFQSHINIKQMFTVVIDKKTHYERYGKAAHHPYLYCFTVLLERYRGWLDSIGAKGDVLAESRGGKEDGELKDTYQHVWRHGTYYLSAQQFQNVLTSKELKIKKKAHNIAGLQVTDLVAYPSKVDILTQRKRSLVHPPSSFTTRINQIIQPKHNPYGQVFLA